MNTIEFFIPCGLQTQNFTQTPCQIQTLKSKKQTKKIGGVYLGEQKNGGSTHLRPKVFLAPSLSKATFSASL